MIRAASVSDLLFVSTTCVNCIWGFFFGFFFLPKIACVTKLTPLPTAVLMSPPAAAAVAVTRKKRVEALCCVRLNKTLSPRVSPFSDC